ncbi:hypothetical protein QJQ45_005469 [Haematococcus lacustris]|nr:hypothetical protein QJQ45_005463 [Haematococcus lacustris]KAJ9506809.1 hypothetical protein QJQ45_005469 [Haematococcus lacustris]
MCEEPDFMSNIVTNMRWLRGSETWRRPQHTTVEQDKQTMPPSMPKQQQDWATARAIAAEVLQQIQQVPTLLRLLRSQPDSKVMLQLSTLQDAEALLDFQLAALPGEQGPGTPAPLQLGAIHFERDDECLTLLCSFAPDSVMQLCTLGKKLSVKMLNEYCKAVGLHVPANTLRADLLYIVLEHLNEQAECD